MNSHERVCTTLRHEEPDRIPIYDSFWTDTLSLWRTQGLPEDLAPEDHFDFDIRVMGIDASPRFEPRLLEEDGDLITLRDRFGYVVRKSRTKSRTMQFLEHPATSSENWPLIKQRFRIHPHEPARTDSQAFPFRLDMGVTWQQARQGFQAWRNKQKYILGSTYGPHEAILRLHGFENTLYSLADEPDFIQDMAETYTDFLLHTIRLCLDKGIRYDGFFMIEDLACTRGLLFSPIQWRKLFKPSIAKIGAFLNENGMHFWMHSCGNAEPIFDDLIACGLDVINPLEAKSGLDVRHLKKRYGKLLTFFGNIDVIAMSQSEEIIKTEICQKLSTAKQGGGYIYHSDHSVPPEVSWDRYCMIVEWVRQHGQPDNHR
jgi:uroporphyrinogen decarboxylase